MVEFSFKESYCYEDLIQILRILRSPGGCPWDAKQTHESIKKNLIEETYEVVEAINQGNPDMLREELGDLWMQIVFHAQMEEDAGSFTLDDVADGICKKLIERHPHVFGDTKISGVSDVLNNWDAIKRQKKGQAAGSAPMQSVPREFPALMRAAKVQQKAAVVGFDWPDVTGAMDKLTEESRELQEAIAAKSPDNMMEELGDLLFCVVNISRFLDCDAEEALSRATDKFIRRFVQMEELAQQQGMDMQSASLAQLDALWDAAKLR